MYIQSHELCRYDALTDSRSLRLLPPPLWQVDGFPTLYSASTADYVSPLLPSDTWSRLAQANSALRLLPATSTNDYMRELQYVRLPTSSQQVSEHHHPHTHIRPPGAGTMEGG